MAPHTVTHVLRSSTSGPFRLLARSALRLLAVLALLLGSVAAAGASPALAEPLADPDATGPCPGSIVATDSNSIGELVVKYDTAAGGTNCARMNHEGAAAGVYYFTEVILYLCAQTSPGNTCTPTAMTKPDEGEYMSYAGPVSLPNTNGFCISASGIIENQSESIDDDYATSPAATACG